MNAALTVEKKLIRNNHYCFRSQDLYVPKLKLIIISLLALINQNGLVSLCGRTLIEVTKLYRLKGLQGEQRKSTAGDMNMY